MAKSIQKLEALNLRRKGESVKQIAKIIGVSASTASLWCREIKISENQISELQRRYKDPYYGKRLDYSLKRKKLREDSEYEENQKGQNLISNINERDTLIAGTALYWAEGFKKDKMVGFSNSDPEMIKFILRWFELIGVDKNMLRFRVVINQDHAFRVDKIQNHWTKELKLKNEVFYGPTFQKIAQKKKYESDDKYFGVLRIRVLKSTNLLRRIKGMISHFNQDVYES